MENQVELIGGTERREIAIVEYDPAWPEAFERNRHRIVDVLGPKALRVDHIGSSAVPGLAAKPIIDIDLSVVDPDDEDAYVPVLERVGYQLRVREPGHRMLRTPVRDVHLHVCAGGGAWERRHLLFRDWLRASDQDRVLYAETKRELAARDWSDMNAYAEAKTTVVAAITERAEAWAAANSWRLPQ